MKFFNFKEYIRSWSVWLGSLITVSPVIDANTPFFDFIPDQYKPATMSILGALLLLVRGIKQAGLSK